MIFPKKQKNTTSSGYIIPIVLVFSVAFIVISTGLIGAFSVTIEATRQTVAREQALQIAEAGVDYYKWHLAHDPDDYRDGEVVPELAPSQEDLLLWLDASDINGDETDTTDGTGVTYWVDKSPQANDLSQIGSESVPVKITDDGKAVVSFTEDQLKSANNLVPALPFEDVEIVMLARTTDEDTGKSYAFRTYGRPLFVSLPWQGDDILFQMENGNNGEIEAPWIYNEDDYYLWTFQMSESQGKLIRNNGVTIAETTDNAVEPNNKIKKVVFGRQHNKTQRYQNYNLAEILIYARTLPQEEREFIEKYVDCSNDHTGRGDCGTDLPGETFGPFTHPFYDKDGERIGEFELYITSPPIGSSVVTISSTGKIDSDPTVRRTIQTKLAVPSFVKYAFAADADMRFGEGTEVFGPIHSNGGVRFDGVVHNLVTSARSEYDDPDHSGANEFGVHTHVGTNDPYPPAEVPVRQDVFVAGREFPVPAIDFSGMIADLSGMKTDAIASGEYFGSSGGLGYRVDLNTDDTFEVHQVTSLYSPHWSCYNDVEEDGWGSWSIAADTSLGTYDNPENGIIFFEDHVWIEGQIDAARLTIAAATFPDTPSTRKNITINNDIEYTNYDGSDSLALIAQNNINVGLISEDDLRIDAALIAQSGRIGRYHYADGWGWNPGCEPYDSRDTLTLLGTIGSKLRYGFAWTDDTGYDIRNISYDPNLLYAPPPSFPLTTEQYEVISWEEIQQGS